METVLENLGLTKNEAKIYLIILKLGSTNAAQIIANSGLHRGMVYDTLEKLIGQGLVCKIVTKKHRIFEAANPQKLLTLLKSKKERYLTLHNTKEEQLHAILPTLSNLSDNTSPVTVKFLKGQEGMLTVLAEIIQQRPRTVLVIGAGSEEYTVIPRSINRYHKQRINHKIMVRELFRDTPFARQRAHELATMPFAEVRILPKGIQKPTHIDIYNERVTLYTSLPNQSATITMIDNQNLADAMTEYFELIWNISEKV